MTAVKTPRRASTRRTPDAAPATVAVAGPTAQAARKPRSSTKAAAELALAATKAAAPARAPKKPKGTAQPATASAAVATPSPAAIKLKLVRDSFTMPQQDFALINVLKQRAAEQERPVKKSELLRAGLQCLAALSPAKLTAALAALQPVKTGRPKKA